MAGRLPHAGLQSGVELGLLLRISLSTRLCAGSIVPRDPACLEESARSAWSSVGSPSRIGDGGLLAGRGEVVDRRLEVQLVTVAGPTIGSFAPARARALCPRARLPACSGGKTFGRPSSPSTAPPPASQDRRLQHTTPTHRALSALLSTYPPIRGTPSLARDRPLSSLLPPSFLPGGLPTPRLLPEQWQASRSRHRAHPPLLRP
jgi:hypothetical protein